jgi:hypothetical protein
LRSGAFIFYSVVETAGIEPTVNLDFLGILKVLLAKCRQSTRNGSCRPEAASQEVDFNEV